MVSKKFVIISVVVIGIILSLSFIVTAFTGYFSQSTVDYSTLERRTDVKSTLNTLTEGKEKVLLEFKDNDACYWIRSRRDENGYLIEILEYGKEFGECLGVPRDSSTIRIDQKVSMYSPGCVCGGNYVLELKSGGLGISEVSDEMLTQRSTRLGITEFIQNLLGIFKK